MNDVAAKWEKMFGMKPDTVATKKLLEYVANTKNPHKHHHKDLAAIQGSIGESGFKSVTLLWTNPKTKKTEVIYGVGRIMAGDQAGYEELPVLWATDLNVIKAKLLRIADNRAKDLSTVYDEDILKADLQDIKLADINYEYLKLDRYNESLQIDQAASDPIFEELDPGYEEKINGLTKSIVEAKGEDPTEDDEPETDPKSIKPLKNNDSQLGNLMFPSEPEWGVPMLSLKYQAEEVPKPVVKWGEISRKAKMAGVWHFYVDDSKFETIYYNDPDAPLYSGAYACVEPNYSIRAETPRAWIMGQTFKKRWLARYWQSKGKRIFVDLNVRLDRADINMLGVPHGWRAYATRGYNDVTEHIEASYKFACKWAETDDIIFLVIGGGTQIKKKSADMQWTWIPERLDVVWHPELDDGLQRVVETREFEDLKKKRR